MLPALGMFVIMRITAMGVIVGTCHRPAFRPDLNTGEPYIKPRWQTRRAEELSAPARARPGGKTSSGDRLFPATARDRSDQRHSCRRIPQPDRGAPRPKPARARRCDDSLRIIRTARPHPEERRFDLIEPAELLPVESTFGSSTGPSWQLQMRIGP
jgi:hypothetical protein